MAPVSQFILPPWTACPPGGWLTMDSLPPGGQYFLGYLAPHPGYLHLQGAKYPGWDKLPPDVKISQPGNLAPPPWKFVRVEIYCLASNKLAHLDMHITTHSFIDRVGGNLSQLGHLAPYPIAWSGNFFLLIPGA